MSALMRNLWQDDAGLILSAELVIILTIAVLGMIVGLVNVQNALLGEFADLGLAFQNLNQSYSTPSYRGCWKLWGRTSWTAGSYFIDVFDGCVQTNAVGNGCEIYSGNNCTLPANGCLTAPLGGSNAVDAIVPPAPTVMPDSSLQPVPDPGPVSKP